MQAPLMQRLGAEFFGTFWLVFAGIGSAIMAAGFVDKVPPVFAVTDAAAAGSALPTHFQLGIGFLGVGLAVGLTVVSMAYAIGHISGCHLNPAVTIGLVVGKRFSAVDVVPYIVAQLAGGAVAAFTLYAILTGKEGFDPATFEQNGFGCNGYGIHSPGHFNLMSCAITEAVLTGFFLFIILGATDHRSPAGFAALPIGLGLTLIHLIGIPITNLSVNPARSTATALVKQGWALEQLWLFWAAPIAGAIVGALCYQCLACYGKDEKK